MVGLGGKPGYVLLPAQQGGGQVGEDKHGGYGDNVLEERNQWSSGRRYKGWECKGDVKGWGELEEDDLCKSVPGDDTGEVESIAPEEDGEEEHSYVEHNDGGASQADQGRGSKYCEFPLTELCVVTSITHTVSTLGLGSGHW